ncbi:hypothetical protein ACQP2H_10495 [Micromonospora sp. CA-248260]|uniref:hypothetical protein n=1 Tax=Micromonospora sp. CA-248260 TaxID=3239962 RepID=UPI003D93E8AA
MTEQEPTERDFVGIMQEGTYVEKLEALRDHLAERLTTAEHREAASISKQLSEVLAKLQQVSPQVKEASRVDVLRAKREARAKNRQLPAG